MSHATATTLCLANVVDTQSMISWHNFAKVSPLGNLALAHTANSINSREHLT